MPQTFLTPIFIFIAVIFCFVVLFVGDFSLFFLGALVPPLLISCARIDLWVMAILALHLSSVRMPGMPGEIVLYELMIVVMVGLSVLRNMTTRVTPRITWCKFWGFCFLILIAMLMWQRGSGFRLLGSNMWGGSTYIHLITAGLFYLFADQVTFKPGAWRKLFILMFGLSLLPALSELTVTWTEGAVTWHLLFLRPRAGLGSLSDGAVQNVVRFQSLLVATPIFLMPFILAPFSGKYKKWFFIASFSVMFLGGLSGHRMVLIVIVLTVWIHIFFQVRNKFVYIASSILLASVAMLILGQIAPLLPKPHQRMLSVIPFANVSSEVMRDASGTVTWRIQVWREAVKMIPQYLWLGKGFAFEMDAFLSQAAMFSETYAIRWALVQTAFHQGILSLLVGTGLPGLVIGLGFLTGVCLRQHKQTRRPWKDRSLQRMHMAIFSYFVGQTIIYIFVYGDAQKSFPSIFIYAAILECLRASDDSLDAEVVAEESPSAQATLPTALALPSTGTPL